jgi:hypothetical protein
MAALSGRVLGFTHCLGIPRRALPVATTIAFVACREIQYLVALAD